MVGRSVLGRPHRVLLPFTGYPLPEHSGSLLRSAGQVTPPPPSCRPRPCPPTCKTAVPSGGTPHLQPPICPPNRGSASGPTPPM